MTQQPIPGLDLNLFLSALKFAARRHRDQRRKDRQASPYINHPIDLADILVNEAGITDTDTLCAALLHDTIEDTETSPDELRERFGERICRIVLEVTDDKNLVKSERKRMQIVNAATCSPEAKRVKLADKIANLRDIADSPPAGWSLERRQAYYDWACQVIDRLRGVDPRLEALFDQAASRRPG